MRMESGCGCEGVWKWCNDEIDESQVIVVPNSWETSMFDD